jgi:hypothetical protein
MKKFLRLEVISVSHSTLASDSLRESKLRKSKHATSFEVKSNWKMEKFSRKKFTSVHGLINASWDNKTLSWN